MQHQRKSTVKRAVNAVSRRGFLRNAAGALALASGGTGHSGSLFGQESGAAPAPTAGPGEPFFKTRGVVLVPGDMATLDWPGMAKQAGLTTIGTHITPSQVAGFVATERGQEFLSRCRELGVHVEHELHAMKDLLPRKLFKKDPTMFPMNDKGERIPNYNLCVHSKAAVAIVCENTVKYSEKLRSDTGRYFYWIDDGAPMCRCPKCKGLSNTDQAVMLENAMVKALRAFDPRATLAHLAYGRTLAAPTQVKPDPSLFLEFAPIHKYTGPHGKPEEAKAKRKEWGRRYLALLDDNLKVFDAGSTQALEYWLDESLFWRAARKVDKNVNRVKIPWDQKAFEDDLAEYGKRGIRHITTFAVMIDDKYEAQWGTPPLKEYALALKSWRPG